ncbi:hypothetical protein AMTR_s00071p00198520 [Amborella trichopoda]|uniref:K-box domain-containing protein n=1 Tax=Amborella trichopoda TaxID=13333 RepID=U5DHS8_AMBTC|nr:hypothetical protein AMTR_s00071p00198520 [Amborella trichopoda]
MHILINAGVSHDVQHEINLLKQEINTLQKAIRFMFGDGTGSMTLDELHVLERNLEVWICQIRSTKNQIMFQELQLLKNKEDTLMAANELLQQQEQSSTCGIPLFKGGIHGIPYPLTLHNEAFQGLVVFLEFAMLAIVLITRAMIRPFEGQMAHMNIVEAKQSVVWNIRLVPRL